MSEERKSGAEVEKLISDINLKFQKIENKLKLSELELVDFNAVVLEEVGPLCDQLVDAKEGKSPEEQDKLEKARRKILNAISRLRKSKFKKTEESSPPPAEPAPAEKKTGESEGQSLKTKADALQAKFDADSNWDPRSEVDSVSNQNVLANLEESISRFENIFVDSLTSSSDPNDRLIAEGLKAQFLDPAKAVLALLQDRASYLDKDRYERNIEKALTDNAGLAFLAYELLSTTVVGNEHLKYYVPLLVNKLKEAQEYLDTQKDEIKAHFASEIITPFKDKLQQQLDRYYHYLQDEVLTKEPSISPEVQALRRDLIAARSTTSGNTTKVITQLEASWSTAKSLILPVGWELEDSFGEVIFPSPTTKNLDTLRSAVEAEYESQVTSEIARLEQINFKEGFQDIEALINKILSIDPHTRDNLSTKELTALRVDLENAVNAAQRLGLFDQDSNDQHKKEIVTVQAKITSALNQIERYITASQEKKKPDEMTFEELAQEVIARNIDPFDWAKWNVAPDEYNRQVRTAFMDKMFDESETDLARKLERLKYKLLVQLKTLDSKLGYQNRTASVDRSQLFGVKGELNNRLIKREDIIAAITHHPQYGREVRQILRFIIEKAAQREQIYDQVTNKWIKNPDYIPELAYGSLSSPERGRDLMDKHINTQFSAVDPEVRRLAGLLFTSFDMLTISLQELQKTTQTRGHNAGLEDKDIILLQDPLASFVHRAQRYGSNEKDWTGWWTLYLTKVHPNHTLGTQAGRDGGRDIEELQETLKMYEEVFYDTDTFAHKIKPRGFCESLFPDAYNLLTLAPGETVMIGDTLYAYDAKTDSDQVLLTLKGDKIFNSKGTLVAHKNNSHQFRLEGSSEWRRREDLKIPTGYPNPTGSGEWALPFEDTVTRTNFDLYLTAQEGWEELLRFTFKAMGKLSFRQITEETKEEGSGGLLSDWLRKAGMAKMFPGNHLKESLTPMLTHFIYRIFSQFEATLIDDRVTLFRQVVKALQESKAPGAGLGGGYLTEAMNQVLRNLGLKDPDKDFRTLTKDDMAPSLRVRYSLYRQKQLDAYADRWFEEENPNQKKPFSIYAPDPLGNRSSAQEEYIQIRKGVISPPSPLTSTGSMLQPKEKKS